ncbi:hypothetical protein THAOC_04631, partial [Thalassiosira oceanica]
MISEQEETPSAAPDVRLNGYCTAFVLLAPYHLDHTISRPSEKRARAARSWPAGRAGRMPRVPSRTPAGGGGATRGTQGCATRPASNSRGRGSASSRMGLARLTATMKMKLAVSIKTGSPTSSGGPASSPPTWAPVVHGGSGSGSASRRTGRARQSACTTVRTAAAGTAATNTRASGQQRQSRFQLPDLGSSLPRQERFEQYELCSAKRGYDDEEGTRGRDSWEHRKKSRRDDDGRKHGHDERGQSFPSRDRPVLRSGDRSQFRLQSSSRGRSRSRDRQSDWSSGRREEKSPWGGTNDRDRLRRSWSSSTRRAFPEESPVVYRSTMPDRNEGRGCGWGRDQGQGVGRGHSGRGRGATGMQGRGPDFRTCQTVAELAGLACHSLDSMSNRDIAAFWSILPRLFHKRGARDPNLEEKLRCVIGTTCSRMQSFQYRDLAQTSLGIAKTISQVSRGNQQYCADDPLQIIRGLFVKESQCSQVFDSIASSAAVVLNKFDARHLSNLIYSFGLVERNPEIRGKTLFNVFGTAAVKILHTFKPQELSNMLWAFVKVDAKNSRLFQETCRVISGMDLGSFKPQALANILWSFSKSSKADPEPFRLLGNHIANMGRLDSFDPQALSNTAWAFATAGQSNPELLKKIGDHVAGLDSLDSFNPQELSNTIWAYATARVLDLGLFEKLATEVAARNGQFIETQHMSNFLWACATVGYTDERMFSAFAPVIESKLDECNKQDLANIAWTYSVANAPQDTFNKGYVSALAAYENAFSKEALSQLHQWQLLQQELESGVELPQSLQEKCRNAFTSLGYSESKLQNDVVGELKAAGLDLDEEVLLGSGYRIDALVKIGDERKVAVEVDGPSHF